MVPVSDDVLDKLFTREKVAFAEGVDEKSLKADMRAIAKLLTNTDKMAEALGLLEDAVEQLYADKAKMAAPNRNELKKFQQNAVTQLGAKGRKPDDPSRKLLSTVLQKYEESKGFRTYVTEGTGHPTNRPINFVGKLSAEGFRAHLNNKEQAKDYVTVAHGVYTHRIQWYCIGRMVEKNELKLSSDNLSDVYKQFYSPGCWYVTFDLQPLGEQRVDADDCRNPENVHRNIKDGKFKTCPLVSAYLASKDRDVKVMAYAGFAQKILIALKMFPKLKGKFAGWRELAASQLSVTWKQVQESLTPEERQQVDDFLKMTGEDQFVLYPSATSNSFGLQEGAKAAG